MSIGVENNAGSEMFTLAAQMNAPHIDYGALAPILILFGAACIGVLIEAFVPQLARHTTQVILALAGIAAALIAVIWRAPWATKTAAQAVAVDSAGLFLQGSILVLGGLSVLLLAERRFDADSQSDIQPTNSSYSQTEVFPLAVFALAGMLLFVTANDLLLLFVALEVLSLPLYLLCGLARRRRLLSQEAAIKYFLLGAFASAFFLYGVALLYGYAGSVRFDEIRAAIQRDEGSATVMLMGLAMLIIGLLFKAGAAPFHQWTPDVYQGAPTPITALMAACTKVAAFGAILRVLYVVFDGVEADWRPALIAVAIITMVVGSLLAVTQTDIKRLLAYSSIANAGFILTGAVVVNDDGLAGTMFYLAAYGFTTIGAFAVVMLVRDADGEATHLSRWAGLGRRSAPLAAAMTFLMLAFAGIPLTSGFTSKFAVFSAALGGGSIVLVIVGVITSMILAFPYLRLVVLMYLSEPAEGGATVQVPGVFTSTAIVIAVAVTLVLGIAPQPILDVANDAAQFLR